MIVVLAFLFVAAVVALVAGFAGHTPADFPHFEVQGGELQWHEK